jgi:predicted GH43/DUF377 family glycosyl hydrolase
MKWKKLGQVFNPQMFKISWMNSHAQCTSTLIFDEFIRVYFSCRPEAKNNQYVSYTAFIDLDQNFKVINIAKKPILSLGELGTFDEFGIYPTSIIKYDNSIRLYYGGWTRCQSVPYTVSIGLAISDDNGISFKRYGKGPILTNSLLEPFELSGPKVRIFNGIWFMYYLAGEKWTSSKDYIDSTYKIRLAISNDGINWQKENRDLISSVLQEEECQAGPDVFFSDGIYHMFFSYRPAFNFRNNDRGYRIGYAWSKNAFVWNRQDELAGIDLSSNGWDSQMQHYPHVFKFNNKTFMLYNGNEFGKYGFGVAVLQE